MQKMDTADGEQKQQQKGKKRKALAQRGLSGTKGNSKVEKKIPSVHHIISYHYILSPHQFKVFSRRMGADIGVPGRILL